MRGRGFRFETRWRLDRGRRRVGDSLVGSRRRRKPARASQAQAARRTIGRRQCRRGALCVCRRGWHGGCSTAGRTGHRHHADRRGAAVAHREPGEQPGDRQPACNPRPALRRRRRDRRGDRGFGQQVGYAARGGVRLRTCAGLRGSATSASQSRVVLQARAGVAADSASRVSGPITPSAASPCECWKRAHGVAHRRHRAFAGRQ